MLSNTTRIAKNTLMLYFRQFVIILINLYTVRVVLEILGIEDFGIFNVVGGVVVLFTFLNNAMTSATQRFLNFTLGQDDTEQARNVFSVSIIIHALIAVAVVILAQTVGLWFFFNVLTIPLERQTAAFFVYQFSVASTVINVMQVPYRATIIAYEKMSFFAWLSIVEAVLKLSIVFLLPVILFDKLLVYAFLVCITGIIIYLIHKVYCNRTFETAHFRYCRNKELFWQLLGFSGWSAINGAATIGRDQGSNILLNIFHSITMNAVMGIATQVNSAVFRFVSNFQTAFSPQMIKSYSVGDYDYFMTLIFRTVKISWSLLFFLVLPLSINADFVLQIWLNNVPEYTGIFVKLILLCSLVDGAIAGPLTVAIRATGDIKKYQLIISCFIFANLPLSLFSLWLGFSPVWILIIRATLSVLMLVWRISFLGIKIKLPVKDFYCNVIIPMSVITGLSFFITFSIYNFLTNDWIRLIVSCFASTISIGCLAYFIGLNKQEKILLKNWIKKSNLRLFGYNKAA